jgi:hypothetical protein
MKTFIANDIKELLNTICDSIKYLNGRHLWWRGQSKSEWNLQTAIYREGMAPDVERSMCSKFLNKARVRYSKCPNREDYASWLFLMQHYGLPTRLLDWSESPLVALYFAVQEEGFTGTLWGLDAGSLNKFQIKEDYIFSVGHYIMPLFKSAFFEQKEEINKKIVSVFTDQFDPRHMVQSSAFTIHGISTPLNELDNAKDFLVKIEIPQKEKLYFRQALDVFGIKESFLFPDLDHLSKELKGLKYV